MTDDKFWEICWNGDSVGNSGHVFSFIVVHFFMLDNCYILPFIDINEFLRKILQYEHKLLQSVFKIKMHIKIYSGWKESTLSCSPM